ncbi:hypothetical protein PMAYCL1PPCAC_24161, partial [Pristionchus mayeri]
SLPSSLPSSPLSSPLLSSSQERMCNGIPVSQCRSHSPYLHSTSREASRVTNPSKALSPPLRSSKVESLPFSESTLSAPSPIHCT